MAQNLVVLLIETGLRGGDACNLAFGGVPGQHRVALPAFEATKVRAEQLVPLSAKAAAVIAAQQAYVAERWPGGSPWSSRGSVATTRRRSPSRTPCWALRSSVGKGDRPARPSRPGGARTGHQFRHTLGTRL